MPVTISPHADGAALAARVQPGAKRTAVLGGRAGALRVAVAAPPEGGRANDAVVELPRLTFGVKRSAVELLSDHGSRNKVVLIRGATVAELTAWVTALG